MTISKTLLIILTGSLLFLSNCKKDPEPSDPCEGKSLPKADFMLAEKLDGEERYFETDKVFHVRTLYMRGPDGYDEYLWQLGTNPNWSTNKNAVATFSQPEGLLRVRLIAKRKPQTECFPNDDGVDTIDKTIEVINGVQNNNISSALIGSWEGKSTQFDDITYTIRFYAVDTLGNGQQTASLNPYLLNLTNKNCSSTNPDFSNYIHWTGSTASSKCEDIYTYLAYTFPNNKDSIVVEYNVEGPPPEYKMTPYTFIGKRK